MIDKDAAGNHRHQFGQVGRDDVDIHTASSAPARISLALVHVAKYATSGDAISAVAADSRNSTPKTRSKPCRPSPQRLNRNSIVNGQTR